MGGGGFPNLPPRECSDLCVVLQGPVRFYDNERKASILLKQFQSKYDVVLQLRLKLNMEYERSECVVKRVKILCVNVNVMANDGLQALWSGVNVMVNDGIQALWSGVNVMVNDGIQALWSGVNVMVNDGIQALWSGVNVMVNDGIQALWSDGTEVKVGEFNGVMEQLDLSRGQPIRWHGRAPPKDRTLQIFEHSHVNITIYSILAAAASAGIVMAITFLSINITFRNQRGEYYLPVYQHHLQEPEVSTTFLSINITSRNQRVVRFKAQSVMDECKSSATYERSKLNLIPGVGHPFSFQEF
uniref:Uncharacterized protein n=1 Tax=Timema cristinae TaxID=61476 RepID=A0A7R9H1K1_TIMCR|nr:unnamed protein product [Timema cristinae]